MSDPTGLRGLIEDYAAACALLGARQGGLGDTTTEAHVEAALREVQEGWVDLDAALTAAEALVAAATAFVAAYATVRDFEAVNWEGEVIDLVEIGIIQEALAAVKPALS